MLAPSQMMKIASSNTLLCRRTMDDDMVWGLLTNHGKAAANDVTTRLHASILMAGRHQEASWRSPPVPGRTTACRPPTRTTPPGVDL